MNMNHIFEDMNKASKRAIRWFIKTVDRRIFNGMSRMWEKFYGMQMMIQNVSVIFAASLICDFCPSDQSFAYSFLQIPSHDGHPYCSAIHFPLSGRVRDFHPLERAHGAQTKSPVCTYLCKPGLYLTYLVTIKLYQFRNFISCFLHRFFKFSKADICLFGCYIYF